MLGMGREMGIWVLVDDWEWVENDGKVVFCEFGVEGFAFS